MKHLTPSQMLRSTGHVDHAGCSTCDLIRDCAAQAARITALEAEVIKAQDFGMERQREVARLEADVERWKAEYEKAFVEGDVWYRKLARVNTDLAPFVALKEEVARLKAKYEPTEK